METPRVTPPMPDEKIPVAKPVRKEPTLSKAPPAGRKFPCPQCGARLDFDPAARGLSCPYCGHREDVTADASGEVLERDYAKYLDGDRAFQARGLIDGRSSQTRCTGCGAMVLLEDKVATEECPFCHTHLENKPESAEDAIAPESLLPFQLELRAARDKFTHWLEGLWFAPSELKIIANLGQLTGVYLPYWTYDSMTYTHYDGRRGDNYQEIESYTVTTSDGSTERRTRTITLIRWCNVSGEVQHFFDDVLVCASVGLPAELVVALEPWDLLKLEPFQASFLSGFRAERYATGLKDGFTEAKQLIEPVVVGSVHRDIGGDHQRIDDKKTRYSAITFKHCLLPVWVAVYRYRDRTFQILLNGTTGKVVGKRPWSGLKIARLVLAILLAVGLVAFLVWHFSKPSQAAGPQNSAPARVRR